MYGVWKTLPNIAIRSAVILVSSTKIDFSNVQPVHDIPLCIAKVNLPLIGLVDKDCWNGTHVGIYTKPLTLFELEDQARIGFMSYLQNQSVVIKHESTKTWEEK